MQGAGLGLFASKDFPRHTVIDKFKGPILTQRQADRLPPIHRAQCVDLGDAEANPKVVDASKTTSCYARYVNEANRRQGKNTDIVLLHPRGERPKAALETTKEVTPGREFETDYGAEYPRNYPHWRTRRANESRGKRVGKRRT